MMVRTRERGPLLGVRRFAHQRQRRDGQTGGGNEVVILGEVELLGWAWRKGGVDEVGVTFERAPDTRALFFGELSMQQIVRPADGIQEVAGGEIDVWLAVGIAPRFIV